MSSSLRPELVAGEHVDATELLHVLEVNTGCGTSSHIPSQCDVDVEQGLGAGRWQVAVDITSSSRIGSIGGLVT